MIAEEIMTKNPVTASITGRVQDVATKIHDSDIRHVPIVRDLELVGMISDRDVKEFLPPLDDETSLEHIKSRLRCNVEELVRTDVSFFGPETEVREIIDFLIDEKVGAVPIVDPENNHLLGIISYVDILRVASDLL